MKQRILAALTALTLVLPWQAVQALAPNDPLFDEQYYLPQIGALGAWDTTTGGNVTVAILDTAIDTNHPDLAGNVFVNAGEVAGNGIDDDGNGYIDDVSGWDFYNDDNDPSVDNRFRATVGLQHGTVVAGVIGAVGNNDEGVTGVSWDVQLLPVQILSSDGIGSTTDIARGIDYAVAMGADVINMSFVGDRWSSSLDEALQRAHDAGVIVVAALGNDARDVNTDPSYPACALGTSTDNVVIGVVALDTQNQRASFSNYGADCADIAAPGVNIFATQVSGLNQDYGGNWNGTSLAAPIISGVAALARSAYPALTPDQFLLALQLSVDPIRDRSPSGESGALGTGRVNMTRLFEVLPTVAESTPVPSQPGASEPTREDTYSNPLVLSANAGQAPYVVVDAGDDTDDAEWLAYNEEFRGGVDVAVGDVDGDGAQEVVMVPGPGGGPHVRVFSLDGLVEEEFFAEEARYREGLQVAVGDVDGDDVQEVLIAYGDDPVVGIYNAQGVQLNTIAIEAHAGDVRVDAADVDGDGADEILVSRGRGSDPFVWIYKADGRLYNQFLAYAPNMDRGVYVSSIPYGSRDVIVTGVSEGGGPHVRIFNNIGALVSHYFAFDLGNRDGVRVTGWRPYAGADPVLVSSGYLATGEPALRVHGLDGTLIDTASDLLPFTDRVTIDASY